MKTTFTSTMSVQDAIAQGYEYFGEPGHEFQTLQDLSDLSEQDVLENEYVLFDKEQIIVSVSKETIIDAAIDEAVDCLQFCDDTDGIQDRIKMAVDWDKVTEQINQALSGCNYRSLTDIKLTWA